MQRVTIVLLMFCVGFLRAEKPGVYLVAEKLGDVLESFIYCFENTPLDADVLEQIRQGKVPKKADEKALENFVYCSFTKSKIGLKDGHVIVEKALDLYPKNVDLAKLRKAMEECNRDSGKTPAETSLLVLKCFREKSPVRTLF